MIYFDKDPSGPLASWLCIRIGYVPTPHLRVVGRLNERNEILGVVGFDGFNGASCQMHSAGEGNWVSRKLLYTSFDYPFNVCKLNCVLGLVPSGNTRAVKFNLHLGFTLVNTIDGAHPDGALHLMLMNKAECRWINGSTVSRKRNLICA